MGKIIGNILSILNQDGSKVNQPETEIPENAIRYDSGQAMFFDGDSAPDYVIFETE